MAKGRLRRRLSRFDQSLTDLPVHALTDRVQIPQDLPSPWVRITKRIVIALAVLCAVVLIVYIDRDGYRDVQEDGLSLLGCFYYATVSLSTTGYGDIVPVSPMARSINIAVITPLRVLFLIVLVGTTVELLTERSRQSFRIQRWRSRVREHIVVVGYGTKGRAAVETLLGDDVDPGKIVVVDTDRRHLDDVVVVVRGQVGGRQPGHPRHVVGLGALHVDRHRVRPDQLRDADEVEAHHRAADVVGVVVRGQHPGQAHAVGVEGREQLVGAPHRQPTVRRWPTRVDPSRGRREAEHALEISLARQTPPLHVGAVGFDAR